MCDAEWMYKIMLIYRADFDNDYIESILKTFTVSVSCTMMEHDRLPEQALKFWHTYTNSSTHLCKLVQRKPLVYYRPTFAFPFRLNPTTS